MHTHNNKLEHANVVAVFENQDDAEEAVLGLRTAGFSDSHLGYFARELTGIVTDFAFRGHTILGGLIGAAIGMILGLYFGEFALEHNASRIGPPLFPGDTGVIVSVAIVTSILMASIGAFIGWGIPRGDAFHRGVEMKDGRYVVSVAAGERNAEAMLIMQAHGGHTPHPVDGLQPRPVM